MSAVRIITIVINHCRFINNSATVGGAVFIDGGFITVANSSFDHNSAVYIYMEVRCTCLYYGSITVTVGYSFFDHNNIIIQLQMEVQCTWSVDP